MGLFLAFFVVFKRGGELPEVERDRGLGNWRGARGGPGRLPGGSEAGGQDSLLERLGSRGGKGGVFEVLFDGWRDVLGLDLIPGYGCCEFEEWVCSQR